MAAAPGARLPGACDLRLQGPGAIPEGSTVEYAAVVSVRPLHESDWIGGGALRIDGGNGQSYDLVLSGASTSFSSARPFTYLQDGSYTLSVQGAVEVHWMERVFLTWLERHRIFQVSAALPVRVGNVPPSITRLSSDLAVKAGQVFPLTVEFFDPGPLDAHAVEWDLDADGLADASGPAIAWSFEEPGEHRASVTVADDGGGSVRGSILVTVEAPSAALFRRGDPDGDGTPSLTDAVAILEHLFLGGEPPACAKAADIDDDGALGLTDAIVLLGHLYLGLAGPAEPFPDCGPDPTVDPLDCRHPPDCGE